MLAKLIWLAAVLRTARLGQRPGPTRASRERAQNEPETTEALNEMNAGETEILGGVSE
jgi:hypothetical protein